MYIYIYIYIYIYTHTHTHIHTYIHTYIKPFALSWPGKKDRRTDFPFKQAIWKKNHMKCKCCERGNDL